MSENAMTLAELQSLITTLYGDKDASRGPEGTFLWFLEEVGELAAEVRKASATGIAIDAPELPTSPLSKEFADVLAWLATLANIMRVDLTAALEQKYGGGCPGCGGRVCACGTKEKP